MYPFHEFRRMAYEIPREARMIDNVEREIGDDDQAGEPGDRRAMLIFWALEIIAVILLSVAAWVFTSGALANSDGSAPQQRQFSTSPQGFAAPIARFAMQQAIVQVRASSTGRLSFAAIRRPAHPIWCTPDFAARRTNLPFCRCWQPQLVHANSGIRYVCFETGPDGHANVQPAVNAPSSVNRGHLPRAE